MDEKQEKQQEKQQEEPILSERDAERYYDWAPCQIRYGTWPNGMKVGEKTNAVAKAAIELEDKIFQNAAQQIADIFTHQMHCPTKAKAIMPVLRQAFPIRWA